MVAAGNGLPAVAAASPCPTPGINAWRERGGKPTLLGITKGFLKSPLLPLDVSETASPTFSVDDPLGAWPDREVGGNNTGMLLLFTFELCNKN